MSCKDDGWKAIRVRAEAKLARRIDGCYLIAEMSPWFEIIAALYRKPTKADDERLALYPNVGTSHDAKGEVTEAKLDYALTDGWRHLETMGVKALTGTKVGDQQTAPRDTTAREGAPEIATIHVPARLNRYRVVLPDGGAAYPVIAASNRTALHAAARAASDEVLSKPGVRTDRDDQPFTAKEQESRIDG